MIRLLRAATLVFATTTMLLATLGPPGPVPIGYIGNNQTITVGIIQAPYSAGPYGNMGYGAGGGGGQFLGSVSSDPNYTGFWCVDDQITFSPGTTAQANLTLLSPGIDNNANVRFSNVTSAGPPKWTNTLVNGDTLASSATVRYEMAAWLISQYTGFDSQISGATPARENAIQDAIWAITNNNSSQTHQGGFSGISAIGTDITDGYWVHAAYVASTNGWLGYGGVGGNTLDPSHWAVVSWGLNGSGQLDYTNGLQTFLIEVVPEPGFYGVLALGLSGLGFALGRKKRLV